MEGVKVEGEESSCVDVPLQQSANNEVNNPIPSSSRDASSEDNEASASPSSPNDSDEEGNGNKYPPIFQELVGTVLSKLVLPREEKIIEKLQKHFLELDRDFQFSEECEFLLEGFIKQINEGDKFYVILTEIIQNFINHRAKQLSGRKTNPARIKKLEAYLEKLDNSIKTLQAKEVDFDQEANSDYILECRLKERFSKVYKELCKLVGASAIERRPNITYNGTRFPEVNRSVRKYVNKHKQEFPDYPTILAVVRSTNEDLGLNLPEDTVSMLAKEAFEGVGVELKRMRIKDLSQTLGCSLTDPIMDASDDSSDPANVDPELAEKLLRNHTIAKQKMDDMVAVFSEAQEERNLEPIEVTGNPNDSPTESESEDEEEEEAEEEDTGDKEMEDIMKDEDARPTSPDAVNGGHSLPGSSNGEEISSTIPDEKIEDEEAAVVFERVDSNGEETSSTVPDEKMEEEEEVVESVSVKPKGPPEPVCPTTPLNSRPRILKRSLTSPDPESPAKRRVPLKPVGDEEVITLD